MKKLIIFSALLLFVNTVFGQSFKPVKLDDLVTVSLPAGYTQKDTLGQHIVSVNSQFGYMVAIREPNAKGNQPLKKENDLNSVLKNYIKGIQGQTSNGSTQNVRDTTVGTLKAKVFTLRTDDGSGSIQYRNFVLIYTQDATYTLEYVYADARADVMKEEAKTFFSSIKLSPELQRNDQYTDINSSSSGAGNYIIFEIAGGLLLIFAIIWLIVKRQRNKMILE